MFIDSILQSTSSAFPVVLCNNCTTYFDPFCNNTSRSTQNMNAKRFNYYTVVLISGKENQERYSWYKNVKTTGSEHNSLAGRKG